MLGHRDEFPEREHDINERKIFIMVGDEVTSRLPSEILPEIIAQDTEFRFRAASPPFIDAYLRTFPSSHRYPTCTPSPGLLDLIFLCFLAGT
jgi:hypothetical protein